jgi:hypothetical protein
MFQKNNARSGYVKSARGCLLVGERVAFGVVFTSFPFASSRGEL